MTKVIDPHDIYHLMEEGKIARVELSLRFATLKR
jgi:hypothetical protein